MKNSCLFIFSAFFVILMGVCANEQEQDQKPNCTHTDHSESNLSNNQTLKEIDNLLDEIYSSLSTNGSYEGDCTFSVTGYPNASDTTELTLLMEGFEVRKSRYEQGLWGYCAKEGAEELMKNMQQFKNMSKENNNTFVICDREALLYCHPKYRKCQCLVDNKNFRNQVSEWWDDDLERGESKISVGKSFCALIIGSDCPFGNNPKFQCLPGLTCRSKSNKTTLCSTPKTGSGSARIKEEETVDEYDENKDVTTTTTTAPKSREKRNSGSGTEEGKKQYRYTRNDIGSVNCQCYGYTGGSSPTGGIIFFGERNNNDKDMWKKIISQSVFFSVFYIFNLL